MLWMLISFLLVLKTKERRKCQRFIHIKSIGWIEIEGNWPDFDSWWMAVERIEMSRVNQWCVGETMPLVDLIRYSDETTVMKFFVDSSAISWAVSPLVAYYCCYYSFFWGGGLCVWEHDFLTLELPLMVYHTLHQNSDITECVIAFRISLCPFLSFLSFFSVLLFIIFHYTWQMYNYFLCRSCFGCSFSSFFF